MQTAGFKQTNKQTNKNNRDFFSVSIKLNFFFSSFTGASNARFDGMVETSMTLSTSVVYNIGGLGTFNFLESKVIAQCRSAIFLSFDQVELQRIKNNNMMMKNS